MIQRLLCLALLTLLGLPSQAAMLYTDRILFESSLDTPITDDYNDPPYTEFQYSNADMSAIFGETEYQSTFFVEWNLVPGSGTEQHYCSGCNGSFRLLFTSTSVGTPAGVFGVGFDIFGDENVFGTTASVTFGDGSTMDYAIPNTSAGNFPFWGITDELLIASIHFGEPGGASSGNMRMALDNLTIGAMGDMSVIPVPAGIWLFGTALAGLAGFRLRAARHPS